MPNIPLIICLVTWGLAGFIAGCGSEGGPTPPQSETQKTAKIGEEQAISKPKIVEVMPNENLEQGKIRERENVDLKMTTGAENLDEIVVSGDKPGEKGLTRRERNLLIKSQAPANILDEKAGITMEKSGAEGMTWRELEKLIQSQNQGDILDQKASITMEKPGDVGMTWRELEQHIKNMPQPDPLDIESAMRETPGGKPLTLREVERLVEMRAKTTPRETSPEPQK